MKYFSIVYFRHLIYLTSFFIYLSFFTNVSAQINFSQSTLNFNGVTSIGGATSMEFGPDDRLYVSDYPGNSNAIGLIKILTIQRNGPTSYIVTDAEILEGVSTIPNHNDDGTTAAAINGKRQVTGLKVVGTSDNPIIYVTSSDVRIGGGTGTGQKDVGLDTNSGVITRMTWTGFGWEVVDIVRGLPRSEENHATNGLEFATINGTDYLIVASGGFTNAGAPSSNFALITEYALAAAVLSVNLTELNRLPVQDDNGRSYIYDLPTLDDPTRPNANGFDDPDSPFYDGVDMNDPWGGNDGLNQAKLVPNGPVQIFSPGYRNSYDLVITESGALYVTDNGANGGWGGFPENEGTAAVNNNYNPLEPGSTSPSNGEQIDNKDHLELVTTDIENYISGSFYGGHPNPIRANPLGAGLYTDNNSLLGSTGTPIWRTQLYDPDGSTPGSTTNPNLGLPVDWPPVPVSMANPVEGDWRGPSVPNPDGPDDNPIVIWSTNTNGITEYKASNFDNAMKGNLLATHSGGNLHRLQLNADGTSQELAQNFLSGIGGFTLGLTANGDDEVFPGTIWAGTINGIIAIFEPQDVIDCILPGDEGYDPLADYDFDGYSNQDEIDNGTDHCNGGSQPSDFDKVLGTPFVSDLNDLDDDGDGIPDALDPMQLGNPLSIGSQAFSLPIYNDLFIDQQGLGGIFGLGLTGLMNNGDAGLNWLNWLDDRDQGPNPNDVLGGAAGLMTSHMTSGTALGSLNTQEKGYQYGVRSGMTTGQFTVTGAMIGFTGPLRLYGNTAAIGGELGFQIGDGTQSNYIKFVVTVDGFLALQEINDVPQAAIEFNLPEEMRPSNDIVFHFVVNPSDGQVLLEYQIDGGARATLGSLTAQGSILNAIQQLDSDLIVGFIGTSGTDGVELEGTWDYLNVVPENSSFAVRINAGGTETLYNDEVYAADQNFDGGQTYVNSSAQVPELYRTERSSPTQIFSYDLPVENGDYTVILHFAEIYWGATGGGAAGIGDRIFDVSIEGSLVLDNYDINAEVGPETVVAKTFMVSVSDGLLNIDFSSLPEVGGVDQPKVSAISIGVPITYTYDGIWTPGEPSGVATSIDNIVIISGNAIISSNTFSNSVIVNPGAGLTIDPAITLTTVNGMTLESFSDSYSSLILNGSIAGTINYERYVNMIGSGSTGGDDLVSPPLSGQRFDDFAEANSPLLAASGTVRAFAPFNNAANPGVYENYDIVTDAAEILQSGSGFRAATVGGASLTFSGTANTGIVNINITSEIGNFGKWNLIGNPYPSYVSIMDFLNHEEIPNIKNIDLLAIVSGIYGYDGAASDGWDVITLANAGNRLMAPGQGFFVAADNPASLQFTGTMRNTSTSDDFIPGRNAAPIYLKLKAATDTKSYTTDIYFNENASLGLDLGYDAQVWGGDTSNFILYSQLVEDNTGLAIALQALGSNDFSELSIPLGVNSNAGHQLRFSIEEFGLPAAVEVYLEDTMANVVTLLNTTDYVVTPNSNLNGTGRFYLRFTDNTLALNTNDLNNIHIYTNYSEKSIVVNGRLEALTNFELYDIQGRLVRKTDLNASSISHTIDVSSIASGVYVVKLKNNSQFKTQKVILK